MIKFRIDSKELQSALSLLVIAADSTAMPMLSNVQISLNTTSLRLTTTNGYTFITKCFVLTDSEGSGEMYVNCKYLLNALKGLPKQMIEISLPKTTEIHVKHSGGKILLQPYILNDASFPTAKKIDKDLSVSYSFNASFLTDAIKKLSFCVSTDETKGVLTHLYMRRTAESLTFVATDGRKLGRIRHDIADVVDDTILLSTTNCKILKGITANIVKVWHGGTYVKMLFDSSIIIALSSPELVYPKYETATPSERAIQHCFKISKPNLTNSLTRLQEFCSKDSRLLVLKLSQGLLTIMGRDVSLGIGIAEQLAVEDYEGEGIKVGLSQTFLKEMIANIDNTSISCCAHDLGEDKIPFTISEVKDNYSFLMLVCNMRTDEGELFEDIEEEPTEDIPEEEIPDDIEEEPTEEEPTEELEEEEVKDEKEEQGV